MNDTKTVIHVLKTPDVTDLAGEKVMIDFDTGKYFMLTGAANDIWELLRDGAAVSDIVSQLMDIYEVEERECMKSTSEFLKKLESIGFISLNTDA